MVGLVPGAYGRYAYGRGAYARGALAATAGGTTVTRYAVLLVESVSSKAGDATLHDEVGSGVLTDALAVAEIRSAAPVSLRGGSGAYGRTGLARAGSERGALSLSSSSGNLVADAILRAEVAAGTLADAFLRSEIVAAQLRSAGVGAGYPALDRTNTLATGMVGAYFPGYGAPVLDASGTWIPLTTQTYGSAGTLNTLTGFGPAMQFDGLYNGLWATRSDMPLANPSELTMALVVDVLGPTHNYGVGICLCSSVPTNDGQRLHTGWFLNGNPAGEGQFVVNGAVTGTNFDPTVRTMPTGLSVLVVVLDLAAETGGFYVNGSLATALGGGLFPIAYDTISMGCRAQGAELYTGPYTLNNGSTTMTGGSTTEDTIIGSPIIDSQGYIQPGTVILNWDGNVTYTLSLPATGNTTTDTILFEPPETRLMNSQIGAAVLWNRVLTAAEIASFSANPLGPFFMPVVGDPLIEIGSGVADDTPAQAETLAGGTAVVENGYLPVEGLAGQRRDGAQWSEWLENALGDAVVPAENIAREQRDATAATEDLAGAVSHVAAPVEAGRTQTADGRLPIENTGTAAVIGDQFPWIEIITRLQGDAAPAAEIQGTQRGDANGAGEALTTRRDDAPAWAETLTTALREPAVLIEWQGALTVIAVALSRIEIVARLLIDATVPAETTAIAATLVGCDSNTLLEVLRSVRNDLRAFVDVLLCANADNNLATDILGRVAADLALPSESIGQAIAILDGFLALETNSRQDTDAILSSEALLSAIADKIAAIDLSITPLPQLGAGRLLKSTGRRRLLPS